MSRVFPSVSLVSFVLMRRRYNELKTATYRVFHSGVVQAFRPADTADLKVRTTANRKTL